MLYFKIALIVSVIINVIIIRRLIKINAIDAVQVSKNRNDMLHVAMDDYEKGRAMGVPKCYFRYFAHICHPGFCNPFDYIPPHRFSYESKIRDLDKNFWKEYKLTPDFRIDVRYVYEAYKEYLLKHSQTVSELYSEESKPVDKSCDD